MALTHYWDRSYGHKFGSGVIPLGPGGVVNLGNGHPSATDNDVVIRVLLDVRASLAMTKAQQAGIEGWWGRTTVGVAAGLYAAADPTLPSPTASGTDLPITITGMLDPQVTFSPNTAGYTVASWYTSVVLQSKGMRKIGGAAGPWQVRVGASVDNLVDGVGSGLAPVDQYYFSTYLRVLWGTPA